MRASQLYFPTLREPPSEAELISHKLLTKAGFIRRVAMGIYAYLPLGYRSLEKIARIVREEMNAICAQEIFMPALHPANLWEETKRWDECDEILFKLRDRQERPFCLGPTHEEVVTDLVRRDVHSYRQLPIILYQIQVKFRDEPRPRGGLMRAREFTMKDAYSFDKDEDGLEKSYQAMVRAYKRIFYRCGLRAIPVEAEAGVIGGTENLEFMVLSDSGEDKMLICSSCGYAANQERAERRKPFEEPINMYHQDTMLPLEKVFTPNRKTVAQVTDYLGVSAEKLVKTLIYIADGKPLAVLIRGDAELNESKLRRLLGVPNVRMADPDEIRGLTKADVGYSGPIGLSGVEMIADYDIAEMRNFVTGANEDDHHFINVNWGRDFEVTRFADLRFAKDGDGCPRCDSGLLHLRNCIEVGHVFKLGTKYSDSMNAKFVDEDGVERPFIMGCYGIGVSRILAAVVEVSHDEDGIIFPITVAPYELWMIPIDMNDDDIAGAAECLYSELIQAGVEAVIDDRDERPGVKFKDADLIGAPIQIIIGRTYKERGCIEVRLRRDKKPSLVSAKEALGHILQLRSTLYEELMPRD
ncbi:MAG: proline--tRNA ligase [Armatimonadota bacterium]|nr:proline--tRNA ligase [Armatimonadota bacterium]MCX7778318.1 proline--tRNA ligase [Armatimonadota bacterium]MDW8025670.1 proline--tRNA ligase [Armatimonadota bacterium]